MSQVLCGLPALVTVLFFSMRSSFVTNKNVGVRGTDNRKNRSGGTKTCHGGRALAIDVTQRAEERCQTTRRGGGRGSSPASKNRQEDPVSRAHDRRCRFVVVAIETGGRWSGGGRPLVAVVFSEGRRCPPLHERTKRL